MFSMMHFDGKIEMSFLNGISNIIGPKALCLQVITYIPKYVAADKNKQTIVIMFAKNVNLLN